MATFYPVKGYFGKPHKENGVYVEGSMVRLYKCSGSARQTVEFPLSRIHSVAYITGNWWMIFITWLSYYFIKNDMVFQDSAGQELGSLRIEYIHGDSIVPLLKELKKLNPRIVFDSVTATAIAENSPKVITRTPTKLTASGVFIALIVLLLIPSLICGLSILFSR